MELREVADRKLTAERQRVVNASMIEHYWDIGRTILQQQQAEPWASQVLIRLAGAFPIKHHARELINWGRNTPLTPHRIVKCIILAFCKLSFIKHPRTAQRVEVKLN